MLRIKGGRVFDPANGVDGETRDICVAGGRIVDEVEGEGIRTIDALSLIHI